MKKIFIEAHKMTREMAEKYGVDYQLQFGLNLSYLLEKGEEVKMKELKGTEKQIEWANNIRKDLIEKFEKLENADIATYIELNDKLSPNPRISAAQTNLIVTRAAVKEIKEYIIENKDEAKWYIEIGRSPIVIIIKKVWNEILKQKGIVKLDIIYPEWVPEIKELF